MQSETFDFLSGKYHCCPEKNNKKIKQKKLYCFSGYGKKGKIPKRLFMIGFS